MGTAYLFTEEAVATGAIVEGFQEEALKCARTVLLESGPGHATRCADTPFFDVFRDTRRRLVEQGENLDEVRLKLETLNLGRLRVASKGISRAKESGPEPAAYVSIGKETQRTDGMYMIGQVAALRNATCRIADLHRTVSVDGTALLERALVSATPVAEQPAAALSADIAIVGVGCLLPHAATAPELWRKILDRADAISEIPRDRFDAARYFDPDRKARDKMYSKWGGFLPEIPFDPLKYGIPPAALPAIDPFQLLTLEVVYQALADAGYAERPFDRERTSVILGASGGGGDLGFRYSVRSGLPMYLEQVPEETLAQLPEWTEDSFAGVLLNVAAGRVANRLDLGGLNFTVDAACASSLAAVYVAARELESGASNMAIVGGIDTVNSPFGYMCFSSAQALSPTGRSRTFDETADGIAISEGLVALILKRVADAERDGDRIYAVIRAVAGSSDGRGKGLTAPKPEGQMRVLRRAYAAAGFSPATVGLVEAHGTGTVAGDSAEVTALTRVFNEAGTLPGSCALGSIKSMIGHTKSAAGVAGLLKVALALYHKVLPPTLHVTKPNAALREADSPFFVATEPLPWLAPVDSDQPRRASVSAFGFGGTNFHVVVEEYERNGPGALPEIAPVDVWPAELACWNAATPQHLLAMLQQLEDRLAAAANLPLCDLAAALCRTAAAAPGGPVRLAIIASSVGELLAKAKDVRQALKNGSTRIAESRGVYLGVAAEPAGKIAFLFPGQGSQFPGMHRELALAFPELRHSLEVADRVTAGRFARRLSSYVLPSPAFTKDHEERQRQELTDTVVAQPALGAVENGIADLFRRLGVRPDMTAGHSYGEYVALSVAGAFPRDVLFALSAARGRAIKDAAGEHPATMAAVSAPREKVAELLGSAADVWIANVNAPQQTVIAGRVEAIDAALSRFSAAGLAGRRIPVACAFHSPLVEAAGLILSDLLDRTEISEPRLPVFSNTLGSAYPSDPAQIKHILSAHITAPVQFAAELEAMYQAGARIFVEIGPRAVLSGLARETLSKYAPVIVAVDSPERHGVVQLLHVAAQLATAGVAIDFEELWRGRGIAPLQLAKLAPPAPLPAHVWMVSGGQARPQQKAQNTRRSNAAPPAPVSPPLSVSAGPAPGTPTPADAALVSKTNRTSRPQGGPMPSDSQNSISPFVANAGSDDVMRQFQQLMSQFLQTQALVMTAYLQGAPSAGLVPMPGIAAAPPRALTPPAAPMPAPPTHRVVAPPVQAAPAAAAAAQPPVVAAPPVSVAAKPAAVAPIEPATPAPPTSARPAAAVTAAEVLSQLLGIVSDRTGYPQDMLDVDANIEADLGIDSIKRMEILTAFQQLHTGEQRGAFQGAMEKLTAVKTLRETASLLAELLAGQAEAAVA
jgi:acyl transferase domain-containing protein